MKRIGECLREGYCSRTTQRFLRLSMAWIAGMSLVILHAFLDARAEDPPAGY
jgi:hypothetical protein